MVPYSSTRAFVSLLLLLLLYVTTMNVRAQVTTCTATNREACFVSDRDLASGCTTLSVGECAQGIGGPVCFSRENPTGSTVCTDTGCLCFDGVCVESDITDYCRAFCDDDTDCSTTTDEICCPVKKVCEVPPSPGACGDPHMTGFLGQKFDFTGEDSGWYCLIKDGNMQVNMRVTSPVPSLPEITYITGLAVVTTDADGFEHFIEIEVEDPQNLESSCPDGVSPCLADGSLTVNLDGKKALFAPGTISLGKNVAISAANLHPSCRSFGYEQYWEKKKLEYQKLDIALASRRLVVQEPVNMGEWILEDPTATNIEECMEYVARAETESAGVFSYQSEHALFQIVTPKATLRLSHGRLHQVAIRDPTDSYDLPDHFTWQMNFAVDINEVSPDAKGVLGETLVPTLDEHGQPIMHGMGAIRGLEKDYRVEGPVGTKFAQEIYQD